LDRRKSCVLISGATDSTNLFPVRFLFYFYAVGPLEYTGPWSDSLAFVQQVFWFLFVDLHIFNTASAGWNVMLLNCAHRVHVFLGIGGLAT